MRICVLAHLFPVRSETFVRNHVVGMCRRGHELTVIARDKDDGISQEELKELDGLGIRRVYVGQYRSFGDELLGIARELLRSPDRYKLLRNCGPWSRRELLLALDMVREIKKCRAHLVHVHFGNLAARIQRVQSFFHGLPPMLVTWHGYEVNALPRLLGENLYHELFASETFHTVGSEFMRRRLLALGANESQIALNPMGIDVADFPFRERKSCSKNQAIKVVSVGRLDEMKGHGFLIEAFAHLRRREVLAHLRIVGEGPLRSALEKQIAEKGLRDIVKLLGALPSQEVVREMHDADLFALSGVEAKTGKVEAQGVVFAEAQATGLPVVACAVGGVADSVIDGKTGILCPPKDALALADAIEYFARNRELCDVFGKRGRRFVEERFNFESMLNQFDHHYLEAVNKHSSRRPISAPV